MCLTIMLDQTQVNDPNIIIIIIVIIIFKKSHMISLHILFFFYNKGMEDI
jgi:hypothetical protein